MAAKYKICKSKYCKHKITVGNYCSTCRSKKSREKDPIRYCYVALKNNAKRRGKPFDLSLEYFRKWCKKTKYIAGKGREKDCYTVDCIKNELGYVEGNIRVLSCSENASKGKKLDYDWRTKSAYVTEYFNEGGGIF